MRTRRLWRNRVWQGCRQKEQETFGTGCLSGPLFTMDWWAQHFKQRGRAVRRTQTATWLSPLSHPCRVAQTSNFPEPLSLSSWWGDILHPRSISRILPHYLFTTTPWKRTGIGPTLRWGHPGSQGFVQPRKVTRPGTGRAAEQNLTLPEPRSAFLWLVHYRTSQVKGGLHHRVGSMNTYSFPTLFSTSRPKWKSLCSPKLLALRSREETRDPEHLVTKYPLPGTQIHLSQAHSHI